MYKCAKCSAAIEELPAGAVRCPACGYRILYKERAPVAKKVSAR